MKQFSWLFRTLLLAGVIVAFAACSEDDTDGDGFTLNPDVFLQSGAGLNQDGDTLAFGDNTISIQGRVLAGDFPLNQLAFYDEAGLISLDRLSGTLAGSALPANPTILFGAAKDSATFAIEIEANDVMSELYEIRATDDEGNESSAFFEIFRELAPAGTALTDTLTGVLLNQAGPSGTGGLDLDNGAGTGSANADAEIRDVGIDCTIDQTVAENWRAQIGSVNGADMVKVDPTFMEGFTFEGVGTKEVIEAAYTEGDALSDGVSEAPDCSETPVTDVSDEVMAGDMFAIFANGQYYLIKIESVNYEHGFAANPGINNDDNYVISIKY